MIHEFQIQYTTVDKNGNEKSIKETYATESFELFGEVEKFALEQFQDSDVIAVKRSKVKEIANKRTSAGDFVWEATLQQVYLVDDEEKQMKYKVLLFASSFDKAKLFINEYMKQGYGDMELVSLKMTKIIDVL